MVKGGHGRVNPPKTKQQENNEDEIDNEDIDLRFCLTKDKIYRITETKSVTDFYEEQRHNWIAHVIRRTNDHPCKMLTFHTTLNKRLGRKVPSILES